MIFLQILKIAGVLLLALLILIVVILLLLLFWPIQYRAKGEIRQGFQLEGRMTFLFRLAGIYFYTKDDRLESYVRFLWFKKQLFQAEESDHKLEEDISSAEKEEIKEAEDTLEELLSEETAGDPVQPSAQESAKEYEARQKTVEPKAASRMQQKRSWMTNLLKVVINFRDFIDNPVHRAAFLKLKKEAIRLLKAVAPSKLKLNAVFSTGAPDTTGILLGIIACFPAAYQNRWEIVPDFEADQMYIEAEFDLHGHIFCYQILGIFLRLLFDSDCKKLYHNLQTARKNEKGK